MKNVFVFLTHCVLLILLFVFCFSCDRIKRKGIETVDRTKEVVHKTKKKAAHGLSRTADYVFPSYDSDRPDTESNRRRFREILQVEPTSDVKNIYCLCDFIGIDYKILISFQCDTATIQKIVTEKGMELMEPEGYEGLISTTEFPWWNKDRIKKIRPYRKGKEFEHWQYLWFDKQTGTAYYEEFSL
jgi:hypothetical protein